MFKFNNLTLAESFTNRTVKLMMIVLGDDNKYWVVTPRQAHELMKKGYELA